MAVKLTYKEYRTIVDHNNTLIDGHDLAAAKLRMIPKPQRELWVSNLLQYYIHAAKSLRHSNAIAKQRCPEVENVTRQ